MLIIGAKGLAKEVLEIFHQTNELENLYFYDDISSEIPEKLYGRFTILKNIEQVANLFKTDNYFNIGIGKPELRLQMFKKFKELNGEFISAISPLATLGSYGTIIRAGTIIMAGTVITNDVTIGMGCLINPNCCISHDTQIGNFVEISSGVQITGHCSIGDYCSIGCNATILPKIKIGNNVTIGAGAVVTKDIHNGVTVVGIPAKPLIR